MEKEHEKKHEKDLQAIRVNNTVHTHNLTIYVCFALCYGLCCPLSICLCLFTNNFTVCTDGNERSGRKMYKTTSGTKG